MAKYSFDFKLKVVQAYKNGEGGAGYIAKKFNIPVKRTVQCWIKAYDSFGEDGLMRSRQNKNYTFEYKLSVVELYLTSEVSYQELALSQGINNPSIIARWVNDFRIAGPDALKPKKKGRKKALKSTKPNKDKNDTTDNSKIDVNAEYVKQLEDENLKLRIQNAYLKELRRLRLEEEALLKKQRELSTASEENSN